MRAFFLIIFSAALLFPVRLKADGGTDIQVSKTFTYKGRYYKYSVKPDPILQGKWIFEIDAVFDDASAQDGKSAHTVFRSQMEVRHGGGRVKLLKIFMAQPVEYSWNVLPTDHLRVSFMWDKERIYYLKVGERMKSDTYLSPVPESNIPTSFSAADMTPQKALSIGAEQFIMHYHKAFSTPQDRKAKEEFRTHEADFAHSGKEYRYKIQKDYFRKGESNLIIRRKELLGTTKTPGHRMVYNSMVQALNNRDKEQKLVVRIYCAAIEGYSWQIFAENFLTVTFDLRSGEITYESEGEIMKGHDKVKRYSDSRPVSGANDPDFSMTKAVDTAVQYFIMQYSPLFLN